MDTLKCIFHLEELQMTWFLEIQSNSEEAMELQEKLSSNRSTDLKEITRQVLGGSASTLTHLSVVRSQLMRKI